MDVCEDSVAHLYIVHRWVICPSRVAGPAWADGLGGNVPGGTVITERPTVPVKFSSSSLAPLRSARCLTYPSHPEGNTKIKMADFNRCKETRECSDPLSSRQPTSSLAAFLFGDFCLESERDFPRDLSFSFSFSSSFSRFPSRSLPFFSLSESGDACLW